MRRGSMFDWLCDWPKKKTFGQKGFEAARRCCENSANTIGACGEVARLVTTRPGQERPGPVQAWKFAYSRCG